MRATIPYLQQQFAAFNRLCFDGELPPIPIVLSNAKTYLGVCAYKTKRDLLMRKQHYDFRFRFSTRFDLPESVIEDTMLHEMIHYHIAYHHLKDTSTHGKLFRQLMNDINSRFDRHITVSHRLTDEQRREIVESQQKRHTVYCVAVMRFTDGRVGIKVIPRLAQRIVEFHDKVSRVKEISSVAFYITTDSFFCQYPRSMALKAYFIDENELKSHLLHSSCYVCRNSKLYKASPSD